MHMIAIYLDYFPITIYPSYSMVAQNALPGRKSGGVRWSISGCTREARSELAVSKVAFGHRGRGGFGGLGLRV